MLKRVIISSVFFIILFASLVLGENAVYNNDFKAPVCDSGDYTLLNPCTTGSLINNRLISESNYPNMKSCSEQSAGLSLSTYSVENLVAWDTDGDGKLESGDTVRVAFDGNCPESDDTVVSLWYSLNPDAITPLWNKIDAVDYDSRDFCDHGKSSFDETTIDGGFTARTFIISGSPEYVAVRLLVEGDGRSSSAINGCSRPWDGDDLVLSLAKEEVLPELIPPSINLANVFGVNTTFASIGGTFLFEDFGNITAYAVLNGVIQSQTLYESGISQYHTEVLMDLNDNTTYNWDFCISYEDGEICDGGGIFTTLEIIPEINEPTNQTDCINETIYVNNTVYVNTTIYVNQTIDLENYTLVDNRLCTQTDNNITLCLFSTSGNASFNQGIIDDIATLP